MLFINQNKPAVNIIGGQFQFQPIHITNDLEKQDDAIFFINKIKNILV